MKVLIAEGAAAGLAIAAAGTLWGKGGAFAVAAGCLYLKSYEWDLQSMASEDDDEDDE